ncbi:MAG: hypothetical protein RQ735_00895 [Flavobacteriaceae bacterium]|nr:hypothetical protein [Flavobacteriaceae bacterium]
MSTFQIKPYTVANQQEWDAFLMQSPCEVFFFSRRFIAYHKERFRDASLLCYKNDKLFALLPGHIAQETYFSHRGLTFGGWIPHARISTDDWIEIFKQLKNYLKNTEVKFFEIKILPSIYTKLHHSGFSYLLYQNKATLVRRDLNYVISLQQKIAFNKTKTLIANKKLPDAFTIEQTQNFTDYWQNILEPELQKKYEATPVHSLDEIDFLQKEFPQNIQLYQIKHCGDLIGGIVLFIHQTVVKSQYVAVNALGRKLRASDYLYIFLIKKFQASGFLYFDLGHANGDDGFGIQTTLAKYKEELGARPIDADRYLLKL